MADELLTIKAASMQVGVTAGTLRLYDRLKLLSPQRDSSGNRIYTSADVQKARLVWAERQARIRGK